MRKSFTVRNYPTAADDLVKRFSSAWQGFVPILGPALATANRQWRSQAQSRRSEPRITRARESRWNARRNGTRVRRSFLAGKCRAAVKSSYGRAKSVSGVSRLTIDHSPRIGVACRSQFATRHPNSQPNSICNEVSRLIGRVIRVLRERTSCPKNASKSEHTVV
jgi:hypothetical protein